MKKQAKRLLKKLQQAVSLLLVLLFLSIPLTQVFHHHGSVIKSEQSGTLEYLGSFIENCQLCEYYIHNQGRDMELSYPPVLTVGIPKPVKPGTKVIAGIYKFSLQGFTNKGPPLSIS